MTIQPTNDGSREESLSRDALEGLQGALRIAVGQIRSVPRPADLGADLVERAAEWERNSPPVLRRRVSWRLAAAVASVAAAALLLAFWIGPQLGPRPSAPAPVAAQPQQQVAVDTREVAVDRFVRAGAQQEKRFGARTPDAGSAGLVVAPGGPKELGTSGPRGVEYAKWDYVPPVVAASNAPVLFSLGDNRPHKLGEKVPYDQSFGSGQVWNWSQSDTSRPIRSAPRVMAVSPDGKWIVSGGGLKVDGATGKIDSDPLEGFPDGDVRALSFSPDGRRLAVSVCQGNDVTVYVIGFPSGGKRCSIPGQWAYALQSRSAAFTADGSQLVLMDQYKFIRRWDVATGKELGKYEPAHSNSIAAIAVSTDGKLLASADWEGHNYLWELQSGRLLHRLVARQTFDHESLRVVGSLAFSPDGKRLAGGARQNLVVWDTSSGQIEHVFPMSSGGAAHIRFSEDANRLTTVHRPHLANLESGEEVFVYPAVRQWTR